MRWSVAGLNPARRTELAGGRLSRVSSGGLIVTVDVAGALCGPLRVRVGRKGDGSSDRD
jgi:hypothetical protein